MTEEQADLAMIERFNQEFKALCQRYGLLVKAGDGVTNVRVLVGSSKPALDSDLCLVYRGRK